MLLIFQDFAPSLLIDNFFAIRVDFEQARVPITKNITMPPTDPEETEGRSLRKELATLLRTLPPSQVAPRSVRLPSGRQKGTGFCGKPVINRSAAFSGRGASVSTTLPLKERSGLWPNGREKCHRETVEWITASQRRIIRSTQTDPLRRKEPFTKKCARDTSWKFWQGSH